MAATLNREIYLGEVSKFLVQDSGFDMGVKRDDAFVDQFGAVNIPQMMTKPTISTYVKGSTSLPLSASAATSDILSYATQLEHSGLIYGDVVDMAQYAFNIFEQSAQNVAKAFLERKQLILAHTWAVTATASIQSTTGSARTNIYANAAAKAINDVDFLRANLYFNRQGVSQSGRRVILSNTMLNDLLSFVGLNNFSTIGLTDEALKRGAIGMYRGFEVYTSNYVPAFDTAGAKKAIGAAVVNTDKESAIFYHPDYVRAAVSEPTMLIGDGTPYLVDSVYTMKMWIGGSPSYKAVTNAVVGVLTMIEG